MPGATIKQLLEAGVHFGHRTQRWNPKMRPFIYGERGGIHVIDLVQTIDSLQRACEFAHKAATDKMNIVFVGCKKAACDIIEEEARRCGAHFVNRRWLGGILTNHPILRQRIERLRELDRMRQTGEFFQRHKKELATLNRELFKLEKNFGGIKGMHGRADVVYIVDQKSEAVAVREATKTGTTVIGLIDTNGDPDNIEYVIPGNDDSFRSIKLVTAALADAILGIDDDYIRHSGGVPLRPHPMSGSTSLALALPGHQLDEWV